MNALRTLQQAVRRREGVCQLGLVGAGIKHSRSPALHEAEAVAHGLPCSYRLIDLEQYGLTVAHLPHLLDHLREIGFLGVNVTVPCKQSVLPLLDRLSPDAETIGAINTIHFATAGSTGYNTDSLGFAASFADELAQVPRARVLLLGAGGAGAASGFALLRLGVQRLSILDVTLPRAQSLAQRLASCFQGRQVEVVTSAGEILQSADGVVNATPIGMEGQPGSALAPELLHPGLWLADVVYVPLETELLRAARELGCRTLDGARMFVYQAAAAFEIFTGRRASPERMLQHFRHLISD